MSRYCSTIHNYSDCYFFVYENYIALFFGSSASWYLCFLWSESYFILISRKFLWSNPSSIYFSFNHSIRLLSIFVCMPFLSYVFVLIKIILCIPQKFQNFFISSSFSSFSLNVLFTATNSAWLIYNSIKALEIRTSIVIIFLTALFYHASSSFFYNWLMLLDYCSNCRNFYT